LLVTVVVHAADIADRDGAYLVLDGQAEAHPRLAHCWVDAGYQGACVTWIEEVLGWTVEVVRKPPRRVWGQEGVEHPSGRLASRCCPGGGWWSGPSPGWAATAA
jgi:hypothetical protein